MVSSFHPELTDDLRLHQLFLDSFDRRPEHEVSKR